MDISEERKQLAGFHQTISQQLNARLEESPRFFWALVVVSTGYGYVLWSLASDTGPDKTGLRTVFVIASLLSYVAVLWASWYLAALGYAFRYLQYGQHCIEHALGWNAYVFPYGKPPASKFWCFWLLPGIYQAHAGGLVAFLAIIIAAFYCYGKQWWSSYSELPIGCIGLYSFVIGLVFIICVNMYYVWKFRKKWKNPRDVPKLGGCKTGIPGRDTAPVPGANSQAP